MYVRYILERLGITLVIVFLAVSINFIVPRLMPGDPIEAQLNHIMSSGGGATGDITGIVQAYRERFGLDRSMFEQYIAYWRSLAQLDLGTSISHYPDTVGGIVWSAMPWTIGLLGVVTLVSFAVGSLLGGLMGWPRAPWWVKSAGSMLVMLSSVPYFLVGIILLYVFAVLLRWFPAGGGLPIGMTAGWDFATVRALVWHGTLPALSIIVAELGAWALGMRGMLVGILGEDFITLADAKGLRPRRIFFRYAMRNAMLPQFTKLALTLGHIVAGAILVEVIFSYPGIGFQLYQAIQSKDYFVIQGIVLFLSVSIAVAMFVLDLIYPLIDPRIARGGR